MKKWLTPLQSARQPACPRHLSPPGAHPTSHTHAPGTHVIALTVAVALLSAGCGRLAPVRLIDDNTAIAPRNAVIFFVDGLDRTVYEHMLTAGELPNIERYIINRGTSVEHAVTVAPSITYAVTATFATGLVPGRHGALGNRYFDRERLQYIDYSTTATYRDLDLDFRAPTIYEILSDIFSVTIQTPLRRGAYRNIDNWASSGIRWYFNQLTEIDCLTAERFNLISKMARRANRWPELIFAYMPATDEIGHRFGPRSKQYRKAIANADEQIGRICAALQASGLLEKTYLLLISDHGMAACTKQNHIDLAHLFEDSFDDLPLATAGPDRRTNYSRRAEFFNRHRAVLSSGGQRRATFYLRDQAGWSEPAPTQLITTVADTLSQNQAVDLIAYRSSNPDTIIIHNHRGTALIEQPTLKQPPPKQSQPSQPSNCRPADQPAHDPPQQPPLDQRQYRYRVIDGDDPLGYTDNPRCLELLDGQHHTGREWLEGTVSSEYPDLPVQLAEMFDSHRAGDLVIFAAPDWDFSPENVGGHGGVTPADMLVPMAFAGPGITPGATIDLARTVDIAPTLINMLRPEALERNQFDGRSLLPQLMQK